MQRDFHRVLIVFQLDDCLRAACHCFLFGRYITENRAWVSIIVRDCYSRFKIILGAGARIYFPSTGGYAAVTASFHVWRKVVDVFLVQQLIAQISLIKSSVGSYLEN